MNVIVTMKNGDQAKVVGASQEAIESALVADGVDLNDIQNIEDVTSSDVTRLRDEAKSLGKKASDIANETYPVRSYIEDVAKDIFPTAIDKGAGFGPTDALLDMGSYMLRAPSAMVDAANPYSTRTADNRYGIRDNVENAQKDRWSIDVPLLGEVSPGAMLHGTMHDKMTVPMMYPGARIGRMLGPGKNLAMKMFKGGVENGAQGALTELLRPAFTDSEYDSELTDKVGSGLLQGFMLGGAAPIAGAPISLLGKKWEASIPRTREKLAGISKVRPEALEAASTDYGMEQLRKNYGKQADLSEEVSGLYNRHKSDQNYPESARFQKNNATVKTLGDVYPIGDEFRGFRGNTINETGSGRLLPSAERDAAHLERLAEYFDPDYELYTPKQNPSYKGPVPEHKPVSASSAYLSGRRPAPVYNDPYKTSPGSGSSPGIQMDGTPMPMKVRREDHTIFGHRPVEQKTMRTAQQVQRNKQDMQSEASSQYNKANIGQSDKAVKVVERAAKNLRNLQRDMLQQEGTPEALQALADMESMARKNRTLEFAMKTLRLGKDLDQMPERAEGAIKGMFQENSTRNARRKLAFKMIDRDFGADLYDQARYTSLADNLAEPGAETGGPFNLSGTNKHMTGRSLKGVDGIPMIGGILSDLVGNTPRGAVRRLRGTLALAKGMQTLGDIGPSGIMQRDLATAQRRLNDDFGSIPFMKTGPTIGEIMQNGGSPYYSPFYERPVSQGSSSDRTEEKKKNSGMMLADKIVSMLVNGGASAIAMPSPTYKAKSVADLR